MSFVVVLLVVLVVDVVVVALSCADFQEGTNKSNLK